MRETDFKIVFAEWKTISLPSLIERDVKIPSVPEEIVSITGPRQAGKTYRIFQTVKELISKNFPSIFLFCLCIQDKCLLQCHYLLHKVF